MIKNEKQYRLTKSQADKFAEALSAASKPAANGVHPLIRKAQADAARSQYDELREQIADYELLKAGKQRVLEVESFEALPRVLIQARIAAGLSQKEFAERLGLKEQQIQRYEATEYSAASFDRLMEIIAVLRIGIRGKVFLGDKQPAAKVKSSKVVKTPVR